MKVLEPEVSSRPYSLAALLPIINRWKWLVLGISIAAAVVSAIIALQMPNVYKSTAVFYPIDMRAADPDRILRGQRDEALVQREDIDRIISIGTSLPLAEHIIKKFDLYKHYDIDTARNGKNQQYVLEEFMDNYKIEQNPREAIEVSFYDEDQELAAKIANEITEHIDFLNRQLTTENRQKQLNLQKKRYELIAEDYKTLNDSIRTLRKQYGILDMGQEDHHSGEHLTKQLVETETNLKRAKAELEVLAKHYPASNAKVIEKRAEISGLQSAFEALNGSSQDKNFINYEAYIAGVDQVENLSTHLLSMQGAYSNAKSSYINAAVALDNNLPSFYIIQKAFPATKKAKPIRWLIVVCSVAVTFFLSVACITMIEMNRKRRYLFNE